MTSLNVTDPDPLIKQSDLYLIRPTPVQAVGVPHLSHARVVRFMCVQAIQHHLRQRRILLRTPEKRRDRSQRGDIRYLDRKPHLNVQTQPTKMKVHDCPG